MSLDAVVYKNIENLPQCVRESVQIADPATGETEMLVPKSPGHGPEDSLVAIRARLGNASEVAWLTDSIKSRGNGQYPILLDLFLYSGSHSGDYIQLDQLPRLKEEIMQVTTSDGSLPKELLTFLAAVRELIHAAEVENNPIVFV